MARAGRSATRLDHLFAAALAAAYLVILLATAWEVGLTRDEGYYFRAADLYLGWFGTLWEGLRGGDLGALRDDVIARHWSYNWEHPALLKTLFGFSWKLFHETLGWTSQSTAYRLPAMVLAAGMIYLVGVFALEAYGQGVALFSMLALATTPRLFHDAHLACFDVGIATLQLAVVYAYWRGLTSVRWSLLTGIVFGLALATKHNAFFVPAILGAHALLRGGERSEGRGPPGPPAPLVFLAMAVLGPLIFFLHWPYLWHQPLARLGFYLRFHLHHEHYPVEYFGQVLTQPPFPPSFVFVMTWVTVPLATVVLMTGAVFRGLRYELAGAQGSLLTSDSERQDGQRTRLLLLLAGLVPMLVMTLPGVPIFGGVKHWFTAMPTLAILAGAEFDRLARWALGPRRLALRWGRAAYGGLALLTLLPGLLGIRLVHPYGIAFYNELVGSLRGAAELGMQRNFWGYASRGNLAYLNEHVEPAGRVFFPPTNLDSYRAYLRDGLLRGDIQYSATLNAADWATIACEGPLADDEYRVWNDWETGRPVTGVYLDEVPMNVVYRLPRERR
jgi:4-amino-4-deoxy-L-arabinose transferase-like glycosyltransferase